MKWLILLFIPLISFSQSYKDLMSISSVDMFKKVVIENGYEFNDNDDDWVTYGFNIQKDSINGDKSSKWGLYKTQNDMWSFSFQKTATDLASSILGALLESNIPTEEITETPYDLIFKEVKEKCKYYKIQNVEGTDFVT